MRWDRRRLEELGFGGFLTFAALRTGRISEVPTAPGVYVVVRDEQGPPRFLKTSVGGHFKRQDPAISIDRLGSEWIENCILLYLGKAENLQRRINQYSEFGTGKPVGHWGGRLIWQLADSAELAVAWRRCKPGEDARAVEAELLAIFAGDLGRLPFANLRG